MKYEYSHVRRIRRVDANTYEAVVASDTGSGEILTCVVSCVNDEVAITDITSAYDPRAVSDGRVDTRRVVADVVAYIDAEKSVKR